ncbi:FAD-binding oxidoreductase [Comamonadaceae bacterium G21597-S1]|nr:FAD-binding oxidoreductase [Comamonadaceae bacterium G21597-S1]
MAPYLKGARYGCGRALCVVRPSSAEQLARVIVQCARERVQVIPQGANTGLVGASSPDDTGAQVVLSLGRMRSHCEVDAANRTITADAGVLLHELNAALALHGLCLPIDLGADPSVGGMVAANTGGARLIRWGDARRHLLAVEAVLFDPPGEIVRFGKALRKDNTGFDLKQLFVGTAGAVGVVTRATFEVHHMAQQTATALITPSSDEAVLKLLEDFESELGDFLAAFEGLSRAAIQAAVGHVPTLRNPFQGDTVPPFAILVELQSRATTAATGLNLSKLLGDFLEERFGGSVADAVLGRSDDLWRLRHGIGEATRLLGHPITFDVCLPRSKLMAFRANASALIHERWPHLAVVDFGHIADGGLHFNLAWPAAASPAYDASVVREVRDVIYDMVVNDFDGSFSAEHGIGPHNIAFYRVHTPPRTLRIAGRLQSLMDPARVWGGADFGPREAA